MSAPYIINSIVMAIFVQKIIKVGGNLAKL